MRKLTLLVATGLMLAGGNFASAAPAAPASADQWLSRGEPLVISVAQKKAKKAKKSKPSSGSDMKGMPPGHKM
ncbi:hypothetical protein [Afipia birgiae]|jgi:hypothetical protein|uniref:hypothetical protein n=1 Tax=Afipia birgiae TaxID=151414 RepID=UPI0003673251|nr:hypothetical protein [Afipia birgiae]MBX9823002.1 hypothetical protein [Afipia birgiae]